MRLKVQLPHGCINLTALVRLGSAPAGMRYTYLISSDTDKALVLAAIAQKLDVKVSMPTDEELTLHKDGVGWYEV